jgi:hypothetical protein
MNKIIKRIGLLLGANNLAVLSSLLCIIPAVSHASLFSMDSARWGAGSLTGDSSTGLQWLDLDISTGISYNTMLTEQADGGLYEGFRYATATEVETLFSNAGIPNINSGSAANVTPAQALVDLLGNTTGSTPGETIGFTGTAAGFGQAVGVLDYYLSAGVPFYKASTTSLDYGMAFSADSVGHWLISEAPIPEVPVPAAWLLFSSALGLLTLSKRKGVR